jgi:putative ABC transport system ATP-binding protein
MGPSGCGKSTLLNIVGLLDNPTGGSYLFNGVDVSKMRERQRTKLRKGNIGFVFQSFNLLPRNTALDNVELPLIYGGAGNRRQRALQALESVGLAQRAHHRPNELAGGEQQRVAIARALINNPSLILADEPTGNLDTQTSKEIMLLFQKLNEQGITIVLVTHEADIAAYTQRSIKMRDGKIEAIA